MTSDDSYSLSIDKHIVSDMPVVTYDGAITVIESPGDVADAVGFLRTQRVVGFDTETKPNFRRGVINNVSLIQISTDDRSFLFRINKTGLTPELREFLECGDVIKVGLSLKDDFHMLHRICEFEPAGFVELQEMVRRFRISDLSLQKIFAIIFSRRISKGQRLTNWDAPKLTPAQMAYASIDAWACLRIYRTLEAGLFDPASSPYKVYPEPSETTQQSPNE